MKINGHVTRPFQVNTGVRQGDAIPPTLFNIAIEGNLQKVNETEGRLPIGNKINMQAFADNVVIVAENLVDMRN